MGVSKTQKTRKKTRGGWVQIFMWFGGTPLFGCYPNNPGETHLTAFCLGRCHAHSHHWVFSVNERLSLSKTRLDSHRSSSVAHGPMPLFGVGAPEYQRSAATMPVHDHLCESRLSSTCRPVACLHVCCLRLADGEGFGPAVVLALSARFDFRSAPEA